MKKEVFEKLAKEAGFNIEKLKEIHGSFPPDQILALEEFAELIVEDCVKIIDQCEGRRIDEINVQLLIKDHFGIK